MSYARKCDRCGVCFDPYSGTSEYMRFPNPSYQTAKSLRQNSHTKLFFNDANIDTYIDLCPACTTAFDKFMRCEDADKVVEKHAIGPVKNVPQVGMYTWRNLGRILFETEAEARHFLDRLNEMISEYDNISILDYADLAGLNIGLRYIYSGYGWIDLSDAKIYEAYKSDPSTTGAEPDYWVLELPEPVRLDT